MSGAGITATVNADGSYRVVAKQPAWTFGGTVGSPVTALTTTTGADNLGAYRETSFRFQKTVARSAAIRVYDGAPVVLFTTSYLAASANSNAFPDLATYPHLPYHLSYHDTNMAPFDFSKLGKQGPWAYFDGQANTFIFSPAANFMIAADTIAGDGGLSGGIDSAIPTLPAGFSHATALVIGSGINATYSAWGKALVALDGVTRPANDSSTELNTLGYWSDHGAAYYGQHIAGMSYEQTYIEMKREFAAAALPLGYLQLDGWWFAKDYSPSPPPLPPSIPATAGFDHLQVQAVVKNAGKAVSGSAVAFNSAGTCGTLSNPSGATDSSGRSIVQLSSAKTVGFCTVTASESGGGSRGSEVIISTLSPRPRQSLTVTGTGSPCSNGLPAPCVPADGASTVALTATASGPAASGDALLWSLDGSACGSLQTSSSSTDANGSATASYLASRANGTCAVTVREANGGSLGTVTVTQGTGKSTVGGTAGNTTTVTSPDIGVFTFTPDPRYLPSGLAGFNKQLGLPFITHSRWLAFDSPYRFQYSTSLNVATDPRYFADVTSQTSAGGTIMYEQDWLSGQARPLQNLTDPGAFMSAMARGTAQSGQRVLHSMPQPRHFLEGARFSNTSSSRCSNDRFLRARWDPFLYCSQMSGALGIWPWTDVYMSSETSNLIIGTLSAGMVGVGDGQNQISAGNLSRAVRRDGVIVKPDVPLVPTDATIIADAKAGAGAAGGTQPMVASTYTDHGNGLREAYVVAYNRGGSSDFTFTPSSLGMPGPAYVWDPVGNAGTLVPAGGTFAGRVSDFNYYVVAPAGASGMAFLGDSGKFVQAGAKRIAQLRDSGTLTTTVSFAAGENAITLKGYAPAPPRVTSSSGAASAVSYDTARHLFSLSVSPDATGSEHLTLSP